MSSEARLFTAAARGDPAALEALWRRERRRVAAVLIAHRPREEDLDDLLQEVGTVFVERLGEVREPERLGAWLRAVALNIARGAGREARTARARRRGLEAAEGAIAPDGESGRRRSEAADELRLVLSWVQGLSPALAEPLLLRAVWGHSQRDIAEWLGIPETAVESRLARARRELRERIVAADRLRRAE